MRWWRNIALSWIFSVNSCYLMLNSLVCWLQKHRWFIFLPVCITLRPEDKVAWRDCYVEMRRQLTPMAPGQLPAKSAGWRSRIHWFISCFECLICYLGSENGLFIGGLLLAYCRLQFRSWLWNVCACLFWFSLRIECFSFPACFLLWFFNRSFVIIIFRRPIAGLLWTCLCFLKGGNILFG